MRGTDKDWLGCREIECEELTEREKEGDKDTQTVKKKDKKKVMPLK